MKIGFDLDYTLIEFCPDWTWLWSLTNSGNKIHPIEKYGVENICPVEAREFAIKAFTSDFYMNSLAVPTFGAVEVLNNLAQNHVVCIVTARDYNVRQNTPTMFNKIFGFVPDIHYVSMGEDKSRICINQYIDLWVDDDPIQTEKIKNAGIKTILIRREWNRRCNAFIDLKSALGDYLEVQYGKV